MGKYFRGKALRDPQKPVSFTRMHLKKKKKNIKSRPYVKGITCQVGVCG